MIYQQRFNNLLTEMLASTSKDVLKRILGGLNEAQKAAVTSSSKGQLQIIAGPGTGKTKVLTSRVAYLLIEHEIRPEHIIVTTFTRKAANEMKERLTHMLEGTNIQLNKLVIGTFHSICTRVLMQYGYLAGLNRFRIAADRDWNDLMKSLIDPIADEIADVRDLVRNGKLSAGKSVPIEGKNPSDKSPYDLKSLKKQISKLKSKGLYPADYSLQKDYNKELHMIFKLFQQKLEEHNLLDFDDLLVKTNQLLVRKNCFNNIQHVLIDEFQDTNTVQLELMARFAMGSPGNTNNITVVGDPDQSIYRFRDAVALNFDLMRKKYLDCKIIKLNENYRSTSDVLNFSEALMRQQSTRTSKSLSSQFPHSFPPVYQTFNTKEDESTNIAEEINFLKSLPGLFQYSDFAILIRAAYQSRAIEKALVEKKIPYKIVKGRAFWERKEVEMIIDLLRLVAYDDDTTALLRTLRTCTTGIGPVTITKMEKVIDEERKSGHQALEIMYKISCGDFKSVGSAKNKDQVGSFLGMIKRARQYVANGDYTSNTLSSLFDYLTAQEPLTSLIKEEERAQNVAEVKAQLLDFNPIEMEPINVDDDDPMIVEQETVLQNFLASIQMYSTDDKDANNDGVVCISTIHSAKGLEWPVVFIPGLTEGLLPASFTSKDENEEEAVDEERRIFYVSTTRAKQLLYISNGLEASRWSESGTIPSRFLTDSIKQLMKGDQKAFANIENAIKLYEALGVEYNEDLHTAKVSGVLLNYKNAKKEKSLMIQFEAMSNSYSLTERISMKNAYSNKNSFQFQRSTAITTETERLPGPGIKSFAPRSTHPKIKSDISSVRLKSGSKISTSLTPTVPVKSRVGSINIETPKTVNGSQPLKKRKTLGVRRRMPNL